MDTRVNTLYTPSTSYAATLRCYVDNVLVYTLFVCSLFMCSSVIQAQTETPSPTVKPPEYQLMDINGINMAGITASFKVDDLRIGSGPLSLSHSVSSYAGFFYGYHDVFASSCFSSQIRRTQPEELIATMDVTLGGAKKVFRDHGNDTYSDMREDGETLVRQSDGSLLYTKKDGTQATCRGAWVTSIVYPNGFTINIHRHGHRINSVTTNTGLQMKWFYNINTYPERQVITADTNCIPYFEETCQAPHPSELEALERLYANEVWRYYFPTHIVALNNTQDYCDPESAQPCNVSHPWPQSQYTWDSDMPSSIYTANTDFIVKDMTGKTTRFEHTLFDTACGNGPVGERYVPRVTRVVNHSTQGEGVGSIYTYENREEIVSSGPLIEPYCKVVEEAILKKIDKQGQAWAYYPSASHHGETIYSAGGVGTIYVTSHPRIGVPHHIRYDGKRYYLESTDTNRLHTMHYGSKSMLKYTYDDRGNVTTITQHASDDSEQAGQTIVQRAAYPETCSNPKTCNKPLWEIDGNGHRTDYVYHATSGQVARVTSPADRQGVRAQVRYEYAPFYAYYKKAGGTLQQADTPVWLVTKESYCKNGAANASATGPHASGCKLGSSDEVTTTYHYGKPNEANNLYVTEVVVRADNATRRTCYEYDVYGNRIGETQALGATSSCQ